MEITKKNTKQSLLDIISNEAFLRRAWDSLNKSNPKSKGLNGETIEDFQNNLNSRIKSISDKLKKNTYKFSAVRGVTIEKKGTSKVRPLRIADIEDRLLCRALSIKLDELLSPKFNLDNEVSFAFRKNKSIGNAFEKIVEYYNQGNHIVFETDIKDFFGTIDKKKLLEKVFKELPDKSINNLIEQGLSQEVGNLGDLKLHAHHFENSISGIPQGNALSPLFANIYLSSFDEQITKAGLNLVRYADDFVIMCKDRSTAQKAYELSKKILESELNLQIYELTKDPTTAKASKIINVHNDKFLFLSIRFDGKSIWVDSTKISSLKEKIREKTNTENYHDLITILVKVRNLLEGWLSAFKFADIERNADEIDSYVDIQLNYAFRNLGFELKTKKIKITGSTFHGLTSKQRKNTGIKTCMAFLNSIERDKIICTKSIDSNE